MLTSLSCSLQPVGLIGCVVLQPVSLPHASMGERVLGIALQCTAEQSDCALDIFRVLVFLQVSQAAQIVIVGRRLLGTVCHQILPIATPQLQAEHGHYAFNHSILKAIAWTIIVRRRRKPFRAVS